MKPRMRAFYGYLLSILLAIVAVIVALNLGSNVDAPAEAISIVKTVYPGGFPVAMEFDIQGAVIDEVGFVKTVAGNATLSNKLRRGDTIIAINGEQVDGCDDVVSVVESGNGDELVLTMLRGGKSVDVAVTPYIEDDSGLYRLGVYIRDTVSGVGTVTYIKENGFFGALGHKISDAAAGDVPISGGKVYNCEIVGVTKGKRNEPGELRAMAKGEAIGEIYSNTDVGVYGKFYKFVPSTDPISFGGRELVEPGKAYVLTTVAGDADVYEIDIIRAVNQPIPASKSMLIRVTDKRLLGLSGGIVQGMSGSPILLDGHLVGAVTHVLVNDPTKGYAIYTDWMQSA